MIRLFALLSLTLGLPQEGWFHPDWKFRRKLVLRNNLETPLPAGFTMEVEIDPEYLGLGEKARKDLSDLRAVHDGRELPTAILPGRSGTRRAVAFRTAADIPAGGTDARYAFYYGNAQSPPPAGPGPVFEFFEDFSRPEALKEKFEVDRDVRAAVEEAALVIRDVGAERSEHAPGKIALKGLPAKGGFALSFDLSIEASNTHALGFAVTVDMKDPAAAAPGLGKKIEDLIDKLGDLDWEVREKSTAELIKIGKPATGKLLEATKSSDAEVKWRAEHVLKEIRERSPAPVISAGVLIGDARVGPVAMSYGIGKSRGKLRTGGVWPLRMHVKVLRDQDDDVTVLWNQVRPQTGHLPGEVERIAFTFHRATELGAIRIDNVRLSRYVDEDSRPTHTLEIEESR